MFRIEIETDNAAFDDDGGSEIARILRGVADKFDGIVLPADLDTLSVNLYDINGNRVGLATYTTDED